MAPTSADPSDVSMLRAACEQILTSTWLETQGFCPPNPTVYPHQWLWDSCFHSIAWAELGDPRAVVELGSCFRAQRADGFVPHMRYCAANFERGPLPDRSSYTQPPIYAHALRVLRDKGFAVPAETLRAAERALDWLWSNRRTADGLLFVVHPWESGADDSPRWDSWVGVSPYHKPSYRAHDQFLVRSTEFDDLGAAVWSREFVAAPAAFNAFAAHAAREMADLTGSDLWRARSAELADVMDALLWDDAQGLWVDRALVGGGASVAVPTLDGLFGALVTADAGRAERALAQVSDGARFGAPYGVSYLPRSDSRYDPRSYWRGPAWPQLNYMTALAARRWGRDDVVRQVGRWSVAAAQTSGFAEYWNPETGAGLGAVPQGWAALAATYLDHA